MRKHECKHMGRQAPWRYLCSALLTQSRGRVSTAKSKNISLHSRKQWMVSCPGSCNYVLVWKHLRPLPLLSPGGKYWLADISLHTLPPVISCICNSKYIHLPLKQEWGWMHLETFTSPIVGPIYKKIRKNKSSTGLGGAETLAGGDAEHRKACRNVWLYLWLREWRTLLWGLLEL